MDEPLSNLDAKLRVQTRTQIAALQRRLGVTTVYVTHDQVEAMTMGDRVAVLKDGMLQQVDTPRDMYDHPDNVFVAGFIGSPAMNLLELPVVEGGVKLGDAVIPVDARALLAEADGQATSRSASGPRTSTSPTGTGLAGRGRRRRGARRRRLRLRRTSELDREDGAVPATIIARVDGRRPPGRARRSTSLRSRATSHLFARRHRRAPRR